MISRRLLLSLLHLNLFLTFLVPSSFWLFLWLVIFFNLLLVIVRLLLLFFFGIVVPLSHCRRLLLLLKLGWLLWFHMLYWKKRV